MKEEEYEKLRHQFQILDSNRDGKVTCEEARTVLAQNGKMFSEQAINDMINRADANKDGFVEWNEFLALMTSKVHNRKNASVKAPLPQFKSQGSMTKEEEEALMAFKMFDNDNDGVITFEELKVAMKVIINHLF